jgi:tetratricopeptide (TPR) repeat protein
MDLEPLLDDIPDETLEQIYARVKDGAQSRAEAYDLDGPALNTVEQMALGMYRAHLYDRAALIYAFLLQLDYRRSSAWRGLGACAHGCKSYEIAAGCYEHAVLFAPDDVVAKVYWGECLCQIGQLDRGLALLQEVCDTPDLPRSMELYVARAQMILDADGGLPPRIQLVKAGKRLYEEAEAEAQEFRATFAPEAPAYDPGRTIELDDIRNNPALMQGFTEVKKLVAQGKLALGDLAGFTDGEMDGGYRAAVQMIEAGQPLQAMQLVAVLVMLRPYEARFPQLAGIALHRLEQYEAASYFYRAAWALRRDAMTGVYLGEARILAGQRDKGLETVREGLALAEASGDKALIARAKVLLEQFS